MTGCFDKPLTIPSPRFLFWFAPESLPCNPLRVPPYFLFSLACTPVIWLFQIADPGNSRNENELKGELIESLAFAPRPPTISDGHTKRIHLEGFDFTRKLSSTGFSLKSNVHLSKRAFYNTLIEVLWNETQVDGYVYAFLGYVGNMCFINAKFRLHP